MGVKNRSSDQGTIRGESRCHEDAHGRARTIAQIGCRRRKYFPLRHLRAVSDTDRRGGPPQRVQGGAPCGYDRTGRGLLGARIMSKGLDKRKETKKKPAKTLEEKRAEKKAKRAARGY